MKRKKPALRIVLLCIVIITELVPAFSNGPVTVAVVLSRDIAPYREALRGFKQVLEKAGEKFRFDEVSVETLAHDRDALIERVRSHKPSLILTLGSAATDLITEGIKDIPVVFSLILPSKGSGSLEDFRENHPNVTGATMEVPLSVQFAKMREVLPSTVRVGVLFDPAVSGPMVESARSSAREAGLELVALPVSSEKDVVGEMKELEGKVDILWSVADSTVFTPQGLKHILLSTLRSRLPFVGLSPAFVKAGALLALSCDYQDVGRQSGELAVRILGGETPARIPVAVPREVSMSINLNTAQQIQVAISPSVAQAAAEVF